MPFLLSGSTQPQNSSVIPGRFSPEFAYNAAAGKYDLVSNRPLIERHSSLFTKVSANRYLGLRSDTLFAAGLDIYSGVDIAHSCLIAVCITPIDITSSGRIISRWVSGGATSAYAGMFSIEQSTNQVLLRYQDGAQKTWTPGITLEVGVTLSFVFEFGSDAINCYKDGVLVGTQAWTMPSLGSSVNGYKAQILGNGPSGAGTAFTGHLYAASIVKTADARILSENIWQIFASDDVSLFFDAVVGGGITLTGSNASQSNGSTSGAISQTHALTGSNSAQASSSTADAIIQTHILTGSNASQANESTSGAIGSGAILAGTNVAQANSSTSGAIGQTHVLSGSPCSQNNASASGAIGQTHVLTGANAAQANASSVGDIVQGGSIILTGANASQANSSTSGSISQTHVLAGGGSTQINVSSSAGITQLQLLTGSNCNQANASSVGAISQTLPAAYARLATHAARITTIATSARLTTHIRTGAARVN